MHEQPMPRAGAAIPLTPHLKFKATIILYLFLSLGLPLGLVLFCSPEWQQAHHQLCAPLGMVSFWVGLIIGSLFPIISLLYYNRQYLSQPTASAPSLTPWLFPGIMIHIIVILGFWIAIEKPPFAETEPRRSAFANYVELGQIYESFTEKYQKLSADGLDESEMTALTAEFGAFFAEETGPANGEPASTAKSRLAALSAKISKIPFYIAFAFAFVGTLIFCLTDAIQRYNTIDLYPKTYIAFIVRFLVACAIGGVLSNYLFNKFELPFLALLFFGVGYFPDRAITFIDQKMSQLLGTRARKKVEPIPLELIQGISDYKAFRLREVGIEDVQNLSFVDVVDLEKKVPFSKGLLSDWVLQSMLIAYFPDDVEALRSKGIRTMADLDILLKNLTAEELEELAKDLKLRPIQLKSAKQSFSMDTFAARLQFLQSLAG